MAEEKQNWFVAQWQRHLQRKEQARAFREKKRELAKVGKRPGAYMGYLPTATWLRRALYNKLGWSLTSQNLNQDRNGWYSNQFWYGRAWLSHWQQKTDTKGFGLEVDWQHGRKVDGLRLSVIVGSGDAGRDVSFAIAIPRLFSYWFTLDDVVRGTYRGYEHNTREFGLSVYDGHVSLRWNHHDSGEWYSDKQKNKAVNPGFYKSFFWKDKVFGHAKYDTVTLQEEQTKIPMPEGNYDAVVRIERATWKRPRWPFAQVVYRANINVENNPIPHPGKGENSWDCEDDATFSLSTPAKTISEAVSAMVESILERREKYGGKGWLPEKKSVAV